MASLLPISLHGRCCPGLLRPDGAAPCPRGAAPSEGCCSSPLPRALHTDSAKGKVATRYVTSPQGRAEPSTLQQLKRNLPGFALCRAAVARAAEVLR